jgi:hypothetical protein
MRIIAGGNTIEISNTALDVARIAVEAVKLRRVEKDKVPNSLEDYFFLFPYSPIGRVMHNHLNRHTIDDLIYSDFNKVFEQLLPVYYKDLLAKVQ